MTHEERKRDFEFARIKHVHSQSKLRTLLYSGGGAERPLREPEQCGLGLWIADWLRGAGVYAHLVEARRFDRRHVLIHREANRLTNMHQAGRAEEAIAGLESGQAIAGEMVALPGTMEARLRTEA